MVKVDIYTSASCSYCVRAKMLLDQKGVAYHEVRVDLDFAKMEEMLARSQGKRTVPQIFIGDHSVGGFDDIWALEQSGKLDDLLMI